MEYDKVCRKKDRFESLHLDFNHVFSKTSIVFFAAQKALGRKVLLPKENELFLDLDTEEAYQEMKRRLLEVEDLLGVQCCITYDAPSASGLPKRHVIVSINTRYMDIEHWLTASTRIALQSILCSDYRRELHSIREIILKAEYPILFVEGGKWSQGLYDWAKSHMQYIKSVLGI